MRAHAGTLPLSARGRGGQRSRASRGRRVESADGDSAVGEWRCRPGEGAMSSASIAAGKLPFSVSEGGRARQEQEEMDCKRADAMFFRAQTLAIVRHFFEISCQVGRLPSILGREFFRARVSHHAIPSFEEQAVFVHDVERALGQLSPQDLEVVSLVGLYQYSLEEVATLLGRCRTTVVERFTEALDTLAQIFLTSGLLREDRPDRRLQRFKAEEPPPAVVDLPAKKPAASVAAETYHQVTEESAKYSFMAQHRVV